MPYQGVGYHSNKRSRDEETNETIRILDTIAVALTTGKEGEVFAVGLDKTGGLKLVLAKNEPHTDEDDQAIRRLLDILTHPETEDAIEVLPFLFARCEQNIKKRVRKMLEALDALSNDFEEALKTYEPSCSFREEFPHFEPYRIVMDLPGGDQPVLETLRNIRSDIVTQAEAFLATTEADDNPSQSQSFATLSATVIILEKSPFLRSLCRPPDYTLPVQDRHAMRSYEQRSEAERLRRRLAKVGQYFHGIRSLVKYMKRFPAVSVSHCWVSPITGTDETIVALGDYQSVMERVFAPESLPPATVQLAQQKAPWLDVNWIPERSFTPRLHAEIRIILHLDNLLIPPDHKRDQHLIGCSKRSCLCCTLWIQAYNREFSTKWLTSGSHGKPYAAWALPGHFYANTSVVDASVIKAVDARLFDVLDWLEVGGRRASDEHRSSGSESDDGGTEKEHGRKLARFVKRRV